MLGKIAGALIGRKLAGKRSGAKGIVAGILVETLAKRLIPTIAAAAVATYAYRKAKGGRDEPAYPSDAAPSSPPESSR